MSITNRKNVLKLISNAEAPDVDVTPMMNIMILLLTILITMSVFTRISMLSFSLPPNVGTGLNSDSGKPKLKMTVVVTPHYYAITYGDKMLDSIPVTENESGYSILKERILQRKAVAEITDEAVVAVRDKVRFQSMVKVMDICRECGFEKVGISSATENAENGV
jgi:biopolymer transport protein ExbD